MHADELFCVDRIEGEMAILVTDAGVACAVSVGDLPGVKAGNLYRYSHGRYERDVEAETARRERVKLIQDRLR